MWRCSPTWRRWPQPTAPIITVLNVVTVHWQSSKWIEPQLGFLDRNLDEPYRVFASLHGIESYWADRFHVAVALDGTHAEQLNALASLVLKAADPSDKILFLDGDAFPVRPVTHWMDDILTDYSLGAIRRGENLGDCQPHPCFAFTTCEFWGRLHGDWREGGTWTNAVGEVTTDVGGTLLHQLADGDHSWLPIVRSNTNNPDPLLFGVYGHRIYHHGAGFRRPVSRLGLHRDGHLDDSDAWGTSIEGLARQLLEHPSSITRLRSSDFGRLRPAFKVSTSKLGRRRDVPRQRKQMEHMEALQQAVFHQLVHDPDFYLEFDPVEH